MLPYIYLAVAVIVIIGIGAVGVMLIRRGRRAADDDLFRAAPEDVPEAAPTGFGSNESPPPMDSPLPSEPTAAPPATPAVEPDYLEGVGQLLTEWRAKHEVAASYAASQETLRVQQHLLAEIPPAEGGGGDAGGHRGRKRCRPSGRPGRPGGRRGRGILGRRRGSLGRLRRPVPHDDPGRSSRGHPRHARWQRQAHRRRVEAAGGVPSGEDRSGHPDLPTASAPPGRRGRAPPSGADPALRGHARAAGQMVGADLAADGGGGGDLPYSARDFKLKIARDIMDLPAPTVPRSSASCSAGSSAARAVRPNWSGRHTRLEHLHSVSLVNVLPTAWTTRIRSSRSTPSPRPIAFSMARRLQPPR